MQFKQRFISIILIFTLLFIFNITVFAAQPLSSVEKANNQINKEITKAQKLASKSGKDVDKIVDQLKNKTNSLSERTIEKAAQDGVTVECSWVEVIINGITHWIDPLIVIAD